MHIKHIRLIIYVHTGLLVMLTMFMHDRGRADNLVQNVQIQSDDMVHNIYISKWWQSNTSKNIIFHVYAITREGNDDISAVLVFSFSLSWLWTCTHELHSLKKSMWHVPGDNTDRHCH